MEIIYFKFEVAAARMASMPIHYNFGLTSSGSAFAMGVGGEGGRGGGREGIGGPIIMHGHSWGDRDVHVCCLL